MYSSGIHEGIIFAEIELTSEKQANDIAIPSWFSKEISNVVTNSDMARKSAQEIFEILQINKK